MNAPQYLSDVVAAAIQSASNSTARSAQQQDFRLGMSDMGHCREYTRLMIQRVPFSDARDKTAAFIGTMLGDGIEQALLAQHPTWLVQQEVVTTLPSGLSILGHFDVLDTDTNTLIDIKTKDGLEVVKREPQTMQRRFQLHGYAAGAVQAGIATAEGLTVANVFVDRSGADPVPYVVAEPFDPQIVEQMDLWLEDVLYAVHNNEPASKDKPRDWCERWCEYFTTCRLGDTDVTGLIEAEDSRAAIDIYLEAMAMERQAKRMKDDAKKVLRDVTGSTGTHMLRWVEVGASDIAAFTRAPYNKIDIRKVAPK